MIFFFLHCTDKLSCFFCQIFSVFTWVLHLFCAEHALLTSPTPPAHSLPFPQTIFPADVSVLCCSVYVQNASSGTTSFRNTSFLGTCLVSGVHVCSLVGNKNRLTKNQQGLKMSVSI